MTNQEYHEEVKALAAACFADVMKQNENELEDCQHYGLFGDWLSDVIGGQEYIIYNHNSLKVLGYASNPEAMLDLHGNEYAGAILSDKGLFGLHSELAFYAMLDDVQEVIQEICDEWELENNA